MQAPAPAPAPEPAPEPTPGAEPTPEPTLPAEPPGPRIAPAADTVDIIIPVYQGLADTRRCLASVLGNAQRTPSRIIVINDASPNPELTTWLRELAAQQPRITLLENADNLGFVQTVNRGMALTATHDVLLLNSDTEVAGDWLDRLRQAAYRQADTGTVTALSNNATICSYPRTCQDNPLPADYDTARMDALCAQTNAGISIPIPTAVGFCMYIRRDCLTQTGPFDSERFGAGYGEENDFCMRAAAHGWQHMLAMDTFVRHVGGVSFGASKSPRETAAQALLHELHPHYQATVQDHLQADPARPWRETLDVARLKASPRPRILAVLHGIGGGTRRHVHELSAHLHGRADFLTLTPLADHRLRLQWDAPAEAFTRDYHGLHQGAELLALLREIGVGHVHYHHLLGLNPGLMQLPEQLQATYDFTAHDYYNACPQIALVDENQSYCGERGIAQCTECLRGRPAPTGETIEDWRLRHRLFLNGARAVLAPSRDAAQRMARYFPNAPLRHAPHLDLPPGAALPTPQPRRLDPGANLRVFVVGALSRMKGGDTMEALSLEAARMQAPLELHLLGYPHHPMRQQPHASLTVHGAYDDADLPQLLQRLQPDLVWFPARWPETYSYTLSACLQAGLPILATDLGAFPERLAGRAWTWVRPWDAPPGDWLSLMLQLREQHFITGKPPLPAPGLHIALADDPLPAWSYGRDYLAGLSPN
ncbi:MAG: glycosyltransferase [Proteobacteria bacterium]|nr:glycosyltransferase [Pseudomonadota bacterium]